MSSNEIVCTVAEHIGYEAAACLLSEHFDVYGFWEHFHDRISYDGQFNDITWTWTDKIPPLPLSGGSIDVFRTDFVSESDRMTICILGTGYLLLFATSGEFAATIKMFSPQMLRACPRR